jgi:hypothetical protein
MQLRTLGFIRLNENTRSTKKIQRIVLLDNRFEQGKMKFAPFSLRGAKLTDDDTLSLSVSYTGGCKEHDFTLATVYSFKSTDLVYQADLVLAHEDNNDACKRILREHLYFDLYPLRKKIQQVYGTRTKGQSIVLRLANLTLNYPLK